MKISNDLIDKSVKLAMKTYLGLMMLFYLLWAMFHDESSTPSPAKFEIAVMMVVLAIICNIGFIFVIRGAKFKKTTVILLLIAAFLNFFMFASIAHNPFHLIEEVQWYVVRRVFAYGSVLFSLIISIFVLRYRK